MKKQGHHPAVTAVPSPPHPLCPITGIQPRRVGGAKNMPQYIKSLLTAQTRREWNPVTGTGMARERHAGLITLAGD